MRGCWSWGCWRAVSLKTHKRIPCWLRDDDLVCSLGTNGIYQGLHADNGVGFLDAPGSRVVNDSTIHPESPIRLTHIRCLFIIDMWLIVEIKHDHRIIFKR